MGKHKKKEKNKSKNENQAASNDDLQAEVNRLTIENEALRARLERIVELARTPVVAQHVPDIEDEEYDELSHDLDEAPETEAKA